MLALGTISGNELILKSPRDGFLPLLTKDRKKREIIFGEDLEKAVDQRV